MPTVETLSGSVITVDMGTRDFEGYRSDVLDEGGLADTYAPEWTDRSELDLGVAMVEGFAYMADINSYYQDRCANEALWPAITQRRSIIKQSEQIDYTLRSNVSASVEMTFVCNAAGTVPAKTSINVDTSDGSDSAPFELESDFVSPGAGTYTGEIALHGVSTTDSPWSSDGSPDQQFVLASSPLAMNPDGTSSLEIWVTAGPTTLWTQVNNFLESGPTDEVYRIEIDEDDVTTVIFGDGVNGKKPPSGVNNISATYRVGGGTAGNEVGIGKLTKLGGVFAFVDSITNPAKPSGGMPKESIEEAKENAPASLKALDRAVTHADYVALAKKVPGVMNAFAYRGDGAFDEYIIVAAGGSNPVPTGNWDPYTETGSGLLGAVGAYITERMTTPVILHIRAVEVPRINVKLTAYLFNKVRRVDAIRTVSEAVEAMFNPATQDFGGQMPMSRVSDIVEDISGVDYMDLHRFQRVPYGRQLVTSTPVPCDITFTDLISGQAATRDRWTVQFYSTTNFRVYGESAGDQSNVGTLGTVYYVDDESLSFLVNAGTVDPTAVERWEIVTGSYLGNIDPDFDELCLLFNDEIQLTVVGGLG